MSFLTHLRPARLEDCKAIHSVHLFSVRYACEYYYDDTILQAWLSRLSEDIYIKPIQNNSMWVIEYKGNIQGFFQLDLENSELDALYVHPFVHHIGLGTAMLQRAERIAYEHGCGLLKLYASLNSVKFYEINGYEKIGSCELNLNKKVTIDGELMRKYLFAENIV